MKNKKMCSYFDGDGYCDVYDENPTGSRYDNGFCYCDDPFNTKCGEYMSRERYVEVFGEEPPVNEETGL